MRSSERLAIGLAVVVLVGAASGSRAAGPRFYPDDPIQVDDDRAFDASGAKPIELGNYSNFAENTFLSPADRRSVKAMNVNTMDEVPDSSWFTNRIGRRPLTLEEIVRGPDVRETLQVGRWQIVRDKSAGFQPGFRAVDPDNPSQLYQLEFDNVRTPELATGAEMIGTLFYHAFGYNVVDVYLAELDPAMVTIAETATFSTPKGRRPYMRSDLSILLANAASLPNGRYRVLVSPFAQGRPMGQFRYHGTRPDDPNDVFPHEHRRELRANRVFAAWLNHDDSRANNTLDMLVGPEGRKYILHYMFDFGSILGSGTQFANHPRAGYEYVIDRRPALLTLLSLGLYVRPWLLIDDPLVPPSVGRFEAAHFEPESWKPEYPNMAFENMRPDDAFWGARIVSAFTDEIVRAIVGKAQYSDPAAAEYIAANLIERRNRITRTWLNGVNPVVNPALSAEGVLTFGNAAIDAGAATPEASYALRWTRFDNAADTHEAVGAEIAVNEPRAQAPSDVLSAGDYAAVTIVSRHAAHPAWAKPLTAYFRREGGGWKTVGLDRE
jgi:hypothetical protein